MQPQALIFDVDGTLAETAELHRTAWNQCFEDFGLGWHWSQAVYSLLMQQPDDAARLTGFRRMIGVGRMPDASETRALLARKTAVYAQVLAAGQVRLRPGVDRLLHEARAAGVALAVVSTGSRIEFDLLVCATLGFDALGWFDAIRCRQDMGDPPNVSGGLTRVLHDLCLAPGAACLIDDSEDGISAAAALGMPALAVPGLYTSSGRFAGAMLVLSDLGRPADPFRVIRGDALGHSYASLQSLRDWMGAGRAVAAA